MRLGQLLLILGEKSYGSGGEHLRQRSVIYLIR